MFLLIRRHTFQSWGQSGLTILGLGLGVSVFISIHLAVGACLSSFKSTAQAVSGRTQWQIVQEGRGWDERLFPALKTHAAVQAAAPVVEMLKTWKSPHSQATNPAGWRSAIPRQDLILWVTPVLADQELMTLKSTRVIYWEGLVTVKGTRAGQPVTGQGYVELTGYDPRFAPRL